MNATLDPSELHSIQTVLERLRTAWCAGDAVAYADNFPMTPSMWKPPAAGFMGGERSRSLISASSTPCSGRPCQRAR